MNMFSFTCQYGILIHFPGYCIRCILIGDERRKGSMRVAWLLGAQKLRQNWGLSSHSEVYVVDWFVIAFLSLSLPPSVALAHLRRRFFFFSLPYNYLKVFSSRSFPPLKLFPFIFLFFLLGLIIYIYSALGTAECGWRK